MSFKTNNNSLPVSQRDEATIQGLRQRISSLSLKIQPSLISTTLKRSKSVPTYIGEYCAGSSLRKWWDMGWSWILSKKPVFAQDLEMNEEETRVLGCHNKGTWGHILFKLRSEIRKIVSGSDKVGLPKTSRYTDNHNNSFHRIRSTSLSYQ